MARGGIRLVLSDVDGTLLTPDKELTPAAVDAVRALHADGIMFTVTSSRPPQGLAMLFEPLAVDAPTHPAANKGTVVDYLSRRLGIAREAVATIGDGQNDTLMFARSGTSIATGNATDEVKAAATAVTCANRDDGFARAMHEIVRGD